MEFNAICQTLRKTAEYAISKETNIKINVNVNMPSQTILIAEDEGKLILILNKTIRILTNSNCCYCRRVNNEIIEFRFDLSERSIEMLLSDIDTVALEVLQ